MTKKFSIIVPIYNVEKYLNKCLDSIVNQNFEQSELEVILIDDGSSDNSSAIAKSYADKYENFSYYFKLRNKLSGIGNARNYGISFVTSPYFICIDSDDYLIPDAMKILAEKIESYPQANMIIFDYKRVYEKPTLLEKLYEPNSKQQESYGPLNTQQALMISHCIWNKVLKTEKYKDLHFDNCLYEDIKMTKLMFHENNILVISDVIYNYVVHPGSLMTQKYNETKVTQNIVNFLKLEPEISPEYKSEFYYRFVKYGYIYSIYTLFQYKQNNQLFVNYVQEANHYIKKYNLNKYLSFIEKTFMFAMKTRANFIKKR